MAGDQVVARSIRPAHAIAPAGRRRNAFTLTRGVVKDIRRIAQ
jgi:hypothetical protein